MVDLPPVRVSASPPFTHVGIDVFGPWSVRTLRARGGVLHSKRWACIFCCFSSRAIHIEVIESMDTSSFINALRRFFSLRGPATDLYSDCGTNFIGACNEFRAWYGIESNREGVRTFLCTHNCTWHFNPPHASHMGGSWERPIGICRRILDGILSDASLSRLTHESLCTFLAEVVFIVNSRPLLPVSSDPECPFVFSPNILLTQKPPLLFEVPVSADLLFDYTIFPARPIQASTFLAANRSLQAKARAEKPIMRFQSSKVLIPIFFGQLLCRHLGDKAFEF